jgi:hypothetical protein
MTKGREELGGMNRWLRGGNEGLDVAKSAVSANSGEAGTYPSLRTSGASHQIVNCVCPCSDGVLGFNERDFYNCWLFYRPYSQGIAPKCLL